MISNEKLLKQIQKEKNDCMKKLEKVELPKPLLDALNQLKESDQKKIINSMIENLNKDSSMWGNSDYTGVMDANFQFIGYEWYYDGSHAPDCLGYGGESCEVLKLSNGIYEIEGDTDFGDTGGFLLNDYCASIYDYISSEGSKYNRKIVEQNRGAVDIIIKLCEYHVFEILHHAWISFSKSKNFKALPTTKPFYFSANNHDHSPRLIFAIS